MTTPPLARNELYRIYKVVGDGVAQYLYPGIDVLSMAVYNQSDKRVLVTDAAGNEYPCGPGTILARPIDNSGMFIVQTDGQVLVGSVSIDFTNTVRSFVFAGPNAYTTWRNITDATNNTLNSFTTDDPIDTIIIRVLSTNAGRLNVSYYPATFPGTVFATPIAILQNYQLTPITGAEDGSVPFVLSGLGIPAGSLVVISVAGTASNLLVITSPEPLPHPIVTNTKTSGGSISTTIVHEFIRGGANVFDIMATSQDGVDTQSVALDWLDSDGNWWRLYTWLVAPGAILATRLGSGTTNPLPEAFRVTFSDAGATTDWRYKLELKRE